jgi:hypothetical protein
MFLRMKDDVRSVIIRLRVTPHPDHAAELQRRISSIRYQPKNGFHRDHSQHRLPLQIRWDRRAIAKKRAEATPLLWRI